MLHESEILVLVERGRRKTIIIVLLSFSTLILGISGYYKSWASPHESPCDTLSSYAKVWKPFHAFTAYVDSNLTISNAHWDNFNHEHGWVELSRAWATEHGVSIGLELPDDNGKGLFILDSYHQMHCLMSVRSAMYAMWQGAGTQSSEVHWRHCFDFLRQAILCRADSTSLSTKHMDGSFRPCRSWNQLDEWASEHNTCWKMERNR